MNVLWLSETFPPSVGGVQQYLKNLVLNMERTRSVVVTMGPAAGGGDAIDAVLRSAGHAVYRSAQWPRITDPRLLYRSLLSLLKLSNFVLGVIRREGVSLVVVGQVTYTVLFVLLVVKKVTSLPAVLIFHGEEIPVIPMKSNGIKRRLFAVADLYVCNSRFTSSTLAGFLGAGVNSVIANPGVQDSFFNYHDPSALAERYGVSGRRTIYTVGRLDPRKGHDLVLEALPSIIREMPDLAYLIGGDGPNRATLQKRVAELGLEGHVIFCGRIPEEEMVCFHQLGDVFVMPNRTLEDGDTEGFGIVFLEAGACRKPVVGGASGGTGDAVEQGVTGYLIDPSSPVELAEKVLYLLLNPEVARGMGEAGRRRAWNRFRWPVLAGKLEDLLIERYSCRP